MSYGKIYEQTFTGSMMGAGPVVFAVWSYAIAHLKPPGRVELNPRLLAAVIGAPLKDVQAAIETLCSSDPESRSKIEKGRRLVKEGEFLYRAPTFERYRNGTDEERKATNAARQKRHREKKKRIGLPQKQKADMPPDNEHRPEHWEIAPPGEAHNGSFEQYHRENGHDA